MKWVSVLVFCVLSVAVSGAAFGDVTGRVSVIDGDTLNVGGMRVRLYGIDAPETAQTCRTHEGSVWACGAWVTEVVRNRFENRIASCAPRDTDRYGRLVAACEADGEDIAGLLVANGLAFAYRRYSLAYTGLEQLAAARRVGLHDSIVQSPERYRRGLASEPAHSGCPIKGNISRDGTRIYHMPDQQHYGRTRIDEGRGERWFCSPTEAEAAGWRAARR